MFLVNRERLKPLNAARVRWRRGAPVAWFLADRCGGFLDAADTRYAAANHGAVSRAAGPHGPVLAFDGTSGFCSLVNPLTKTGVGSISARALSPAGGDGRIINDAGNDYVIQALGGFWRCLIFDGGANRPVVGPLIVNGRWTRLCMTWDGLAVKLYVDGALAGSTAAGTIPPGDRGATAAIGATTTAANFFPGQIDDVRLFDYPLTAAQVAGEHYDPWWRLRHRRRTPSGFIPPVFTSPSQRRSHPTRLGPDPLRTTPLKSGPKAARSHPSRTGPDPLRSTPS